MLNMNETINVTPKSPWYTLLTNPGQFFATRAPQLSYGRLGLVVTALSFLVNAVMNLYYFQSPAFHLLTVKWTAAQLAQSKLISFIGPLIIPWTSAVFYSLFYWIVPKLFATKITFRNALSLGLTVFLVSSLGSEIIDLIATVITGHFHSGITLLGDYLQAGTAMYSLLGRFGLFSLLSWYVMGKAIAALTQLSSKKSYLIAFIIFFLTM